MSETIIIDVNTPYKTASTLVTLLILDNFNCASPSAFEHPLIPETLDPERIEEINCSEIRLAVTKRHSIHKLPLQSGVRVVRLTITRPLDEILESYINHKSRGSSSWSWLLTNFATVIFKSWETKLLVNSMADSDLKFQHRELIHDPINCINRIQSLITVNTVQDQPNLDSIYENKKKSVNFQSRTGHGEFFFNRKSLSDRKRLFIRLLGYIGLLVEVFVPDQLNIKIWSWLRC